ncbi:MAG TPA: glycosyltransferase family 39 protein [Anaerolineae bacterium]|nr:glycosyltransferase family 39 protein [Anaerolineae bacterium]
MTAENATFVRRISLAALFILLLAFALRVYRLDAQSLWYDEGLSAYLAALPPGETIAQSAITDHPPLHALLLNVWMRAAGSSEFSIRFASVFFGTLAVALAHALGRRVGGHRVGLIGAGLMAVAPMAVWYGQEARGYSLLITLILIAALAFLRWVIGDWRRRVWLAYILSCTAALYTHYFAAFPIVAINLAFLVHLARSKLPDRYSVLRVPCSGDSSTPHKPHAARDTQHATRSTQHKIRAWLLAQLAIAVLFLPWLPNALAQAASNATYFPGRVTWDTVVFDTWRAFTAGELPSPALPDLSHLVSVLWLAIILAGLASRFIRRATTPHSNSHSDPVLVFLLVVPLVLMSILAWERPKFAPRYLLPSLPAFVTLAALGIDALLRFRNRLLFVLAAILLLSILALDLLVAAQIQLDPSVARPDVRSVAAYIEDHELSGDAILLVGGHQAPVFDYYYRGSADVIPLPPDLLPAAQSPLDTRAVTRLADIAMKHPRAWLVLWQQNIADPTEVILSELQEQADHLEVGRNFHEMSLLLFDLRDAEFQAEPQQPVAVEFEEPIRLVGFDLNSNRSLPGEALDLALYFESSGLIARNYHAFTHLVSPDGSIAAQADGIAGADSYPTSLWPAGARMRNRFSIRLPPDLPPGDYRLRVGLYDDAGRLPLSTGGDAIDLATITIRP